MLNIYKKVVFNFEKNLNGQNHSSGSKYLIKHFPPTKLLILPPTWEQISLPHPLTLFWKPWSRGSAPNKNKIKARYTARRVWLKETDGAIAEK